MYCRKCGKQIDYDSPICKECQEELIHSISQVEPKVEVKEVVQPQQAQKPQPQGSRMEGFGKALTSTILGVVSYVLVLFAFIFIVAGGAARDATMYDEYAYSSATSMFSLGIVCMMISIGLAITSLILGIKSIKCFIKQKKEGKVKPIATLILGITGVAGSGLTFFFGFLALIATAGFSSAV